MNQANVDRAHRIKRGTQKVGHAHDERQAGREVLKKELEDTKLPAGSICDILIPLQNPKKSARADVDQGGLDDLIEKIKRSNQSDLGDVADDWNLIHDAQPVR